MEENKKNEEMEQEELKNPWQMQKESWYDKIPFTAQQMDWIVWGCWAALGLCAVLIALDALDIFHLFG